MSSPEQTVGEYLIHRLYHHGVRHVFGIPGDYILGFFKQLEASPLEVINTCDEQGAGFAADAYARIKGMGAVCITYGVGGLKVVNTTAQAFAEESPVVVISGAPGIEEQKGDPLLHHKARNFDTQLKVFEQLTVARTVLEHPETACREIDRVLSAAVCYRRPVYIELPRDIVHKKVYPQPETIRVPEANQGPLQEALVEAVDRINSARQPAILAGVELLRYGLTPLLRQLVEKTNIPVASTVLAKSSIGEGHPLYLGIYEGVMSSEQVRQYVEASDCLILLGVFLTDIDLGIFTSHLDQGRSISSTSDKTSIHFHTYHGVYLNGFLNGLLKAAIRQRQISEIPQRPAPRVFQAKASQRITVERVFQQLEAVLNESNFVIADTGDALFASTNVAIPKAMEFMSGSYYASLGFAVPGSIGIQLALPHVRPLVLVGDGAFQMTGMELATAARYHLNPIVIVLNNYGYGTERPMLDGGFNDIYPWRYSRLPQVLLAGRGFDVHTEEEFAAALKEAFAYTEGFCLLEIHLDPHDISPVLQRLASGLGKRVKNDSSAMR
jgi:TPP-dependent 2-oxoacid decarboxylase